MASDSNTTIVSFKIRVLGSECPALYFLFINTLLETIAFRSTASSSSTGSTTIADVLDFTSVFKAAQAISSSLKSDQLIASLTRIILENSGAKKAVLILPQEEDTWEVKAITFIEDEEIQTILNLQLLDKCPLISTKVLTARF